MDEAGAAPKRDADKRAKKGGHWRAWLRAIHRDAGHLAVGLTIIYALSGLAVNHIADWEPNYEEYQRSFELGGPLSGSDDEIAEKALAAAGAKGPARDVYRAAPDDLQVVLDRRTLHVNVQSGHVVDEGQRPRFFLRAANWLHLNRGKKAWTYVADLYAAGLLLLAVSGMLMTPGRKGLKGRGGVLVLLGAAIPALYVHFSGGPDAPSSRPTPAAMPGGDR